MLKLIKYYYIKSDHIFASPEFDNQEIVNVNSEEKLKNFLK